MNSLLDTAVLETHAQELGADLVAQICQRFLDDAPNTLAAIAAAVQAQDADAARRGAHRLAGGALSVGLSQLAGRTRLAEEALRAGDLPAGWAALHDLLATVQSDLDALAQWRAGAD